MTLAAFQSSLAELVASQTPPEVSTGTHALLELRRLDDLARQRGVAVMHMLYCSWRLTKVLSLLPFTAQVLGDVPMSTYLKAFWERKRATSFYFIEECLAFLNFLDDAVVEAPAYWRDVAAFERARLRLRAAQSRGIPAAVEQVHFEWDPGVLFAALNARREIVAVPRCDLFLQGELTAQGQERWIVCTTCDERAVPE